jgi:hypothetical protein
LFWYLLGGVLLFWLDFVGVRFVNVAFALMNET